MARKAIVAIAARTAVSMVTMSGQIKNAARFAAWGEGWVMPMVLMKAFAMKWRNFMLLR